METYKHNFAGISSNGDRKFEDEFEVIYDNGDNEFIAISKDEYQCYLDRKTVNYRVALQIQDGYDFEQEGKMFVTILLVPCYRSLHKTNKENFFKSYAGGLVDEKEYGKKNDTFYFNDAIWDGTTVDLYHEVIEYGESSSDYMNKRDEICSDAANTYQCMTGLIGFYLDRITNLLGMTGWDWLEQFCLGKTMPQTLRKLKKRYKETA